MSKTDFNNLPEKVDILHEKIDTLTNLIEILSDKKKAKKNYLDINGASEKTGQAVQTIYGKVSKNLFPHRKVGGRLIFIESELDDYMNGIWQSEN